MRLAVEYKYCSVHGLLGNFAIDVLAQYFFFYCNN